MLQESKWIQHVSWTDRTPFCHVSLFAPLSGTFFSDAGFWCVVPVLSFSCIASFLWGWFLPVPCPPVIGRNVVLRPVSCDNSWVTVPLWQHALSMFSSPHGSLSIPAWCLWGHLQCSQVSPSPLCRLLLSVLHLPVSSFTLISNSSTLLASMFMSILLFPIFLLLLMLDNKGATPETESIRGQNYPNKI